MTDDPVHRKGLLFAFHVDVSDPIKHEPISEIAFRALVDQNPAQSSTWCFLNNITIQAF
jgi:hypothetical protein